MLEQRACVGCVCGLRVWAMLLSLLAVMLFFGEQREVRFRDSILVRFVMGIKSGSKPCSILTFQQARLLLAKDPSLAFKNIYDNRIWGTAGNGSGDGSTIDYSERARHILKEFIVEKKIHSVLDAPCGSFHWMPLVLSHFNASGWRLEYTGVDVVDTVIKANAFAYANITNVHFHLADLTKDDLPGGADLIFSRDALQHLSLVQVKAALGTYRKADPKFLLVGSYPFTPTNVDIETGDYQPINLMAPPFNLRPEEVLSEHDQDHKHLLVFTQAQIRNWHHI